MKKTQFVKGDITIYLLPLDSGEPLEMQAAEVNVELEYSIDSQSLRSPLVAASDINLTNCRIADEEVQFEQVDDTDFQFTAVKGSDISAFIGIDTWRAWQQAIASELSETDPANRT